MAEEKMTNVQVGTAFFKRGIKLKNVRNRCRKAFHNGCLQMHAMLTLL